MTKKNLSDISASVRQRLLNLSRDSKEDFQLVLTRFVLERFLYRLSRSEHRNRFVLKGAMLFSLWGDTPHRATRIIDLLGFGESAVAEMARTFRDICSTLVEEDGVIFLPETVTGIDIREDQEYDGVRITLEARLGTARVPVQVDIEFGDAVTPATKDAEYPTMLDFPAPHLRTYPRETVVAKKFHAMVYLGIANSRMKDFYDLLILAKMFAFEGEVLAKAIEATFKRRDTALPRALPVALTEEFSEDPGKQTQWLAFIKRNRLSPADLSLAEVVVEIANFLHPFLATAAGSQAGHITWAAGGPWAMNQSRVGPSHDR